MGEAYMMREVLPTEAISVGYFWMLDPSDKWERRKGWRLTEVRSVLSVSGDHYEFCELHGLGWNKVPEVAKWIRIDPPKAEGEEESDGVPKV